MLSDRENCFPIAGGTKLGISVPALRRKTHARYEGRWPLADARYYGRVQRAVRRCGGRAKRKSDYPVM